MKYKLLVADIDGTMVNNARKMLPITRDALNKLHDEGIVLAIASGRPIDKNVLKLAEGYGLNFQFDAFIGMNGGQVYDRRTNWTKGYFKLKKEAIKEILEFMEPWDLTAFVYMDDGNMKATRIDDMMEASMIRNSITTHVVDDIAELYQEDNNKLLYRVPDNKNIDEIVEYARKYCNEDYQCFKTTPEMIEFQDPRVNKGVALLALAEEMNFSIEEVIAFGDTTNDNEMLKEAGYSVCLLNGSDDTKAFADVITEEDNENDGMGKYIFKHYHELFA